MRIGSNIIFCLGKNMSSVMYYRTGRAIITKGAPHSHSDFLFFIRCYFLSGWAFYISIDINDIYLPMIILKISLVYDNYFRAKNSWSITLDRFWTKCFIKVKLNMQLKGFAILSTEGWKLKLPTFCNAGQGLFCAFH